MRTCPMCAGAGEVAERKPLTNRQAEVLEAIRFHVRIQGNGPTYEWLARKLDLKSLGTVHEHIHTLADKGYIALEPCTYQGIRLIDDPPQRKAG